MINQAILVGRVGKIYDTRYYNDEKICSFSLATTEKGKDKPTTWHSVTAWAKLADIVTEYVTVGCTLYIQGRIEYQEYTTSDGILKNKTVIVAQKINILSSKNEKKQAEKQPETTQNADDLYKDDIPF